MNETANSERAKAMQPETARGRLTEHPELQAEAIARHYLAHAQIAQQTLYMIDNKNKYGPTPDIERVIQKQVETFKENHANDLGIALEWPEKDL